MIEEERNLLLLRPEDATIQNASGAVSLPDYDEFRSWQLGRSVYFRHGGERTYGIVVGKFVWRSAIAESSSASGLRLLALIRQRTNELILSSEATELHLDNGDLAENREEVYIQGISLVGIVATLIANVTYVASTTPPRGLDSSRQGIAFALYLAVPKILPCWSLPCGDFSCWGLVCILGGSLVASCSICLGRMHPVV